MLVFINMSLVTWAEYDIMAPVPPKTEEALAVAFISNCGARNLRLQALEMLSAFCGRLPGVHAS